MCYDTGSGFLPFYLQELLLTFLLFGFFNFFAQVAFAITL